MARYTGVTTASTANADSNPLSTSSSRLGKIVDQVVIGTPGTLKRWMTRDRILETKHIKILVFDEADQMLAQDGFQDDSMRMLKNIERSHANLQVRGVMTWSHYVRIAVKEDLLMSQYLLQM
jgi:ATP-dependent RNA helicase DDX19/DBP5